LITDSAVHAEFWDNDIKYAEKIAVGGWRHRQVRDLVERTVSAWDERPITAVPSAEKASRNAPMSMTSSRRQHKATGAL